MNLAPLITLLTSLAHFLMNVAFIISMIYSGKFLFGLVSISKYGTHGASITPGRLAGFFVAGSLLYNFWGFAGDSALTVFGVGMEESNPLTWSAVNDSTAADVLMATMVYRLMQLYGLMFMAAAVMGLPELGNPASSRVTATSLISKWVAGVFLFMPTYTVSAVGELIPLIADFGEWMGAKHV
jgi:hypothetical protein